LTTIGAFAFVSMVRDAAGVEQTQLAHWAGLGRRYPVAGAVFSMFLLSFAGIPLTSGFISKFGAFKAAAEGGAAPLVIVGVVASAIAAYFYVRVIVLMFFTDPADDAPEVRPPGPMTLIAIAVPLAATFILGAFPQPMLDIVDGAARFFGS
jgi:NADH-quinone oxidoreductase subunit N